MYYFSKNSRRMIVHTGNCSFKNRITPQSMDIFLTPEEAYRSGYRLCSRCNPLATQFRKEEKDICEFCTKNQISLRYSVRDLKISTPQGKWIIALSPSGSTMLYHKNTKHTKPNEQLPYSTYHDQKITYNSLIKYFTYIINHDKYRKKHPNHYVLKRRGQYDVVQSAPRKGTKRWRKEQEKYKRRERRKAIKRVLDLIDAYSSING